MDRRRFISLVGAGTLAGSAGCLGGATGAGVGPPVSEDDGGTAVGAGNVAYRDVDLPVEDSELVRGAPKDAIPAITEPVFGSDWAGLEPTVTGAVPTLEDDEPVVGVELGDATRAYPLSVLNWHEVVNDVVPGAGPDGGDRPVLVTFCPLCNSAVVADRIVDGRTLTFGVSGWLYQSDLVMYDTATESLWSQVLARAIQGPLTGTALSLLPVTVSTWAEWRATHPGTAVLRPPPESRTIVGLVTRDYDRDPYRGYAELNAAGLGYNEEIDPRLPPKVTVLGVAHDGQARAYPLDRVVEAGVVNDRVGGLPVVVAATAESSLFAYVRRIDGRTLRFERDGGRLVGGGSGWEIAGGRAVSGPLEGRRLERANDRSPMFWFAWADFFPDTDIYGG